MAIGAEARSSNPQPDGPGRNKGGNNIRLFPGVTTLEDPVFIPIHAKPRLLGPSPELRERMKTLAAISKYKRLGLLDVNTETGKFNLTRLVLSGPIDKASFERLSKFEYKKDGRALAEIKEAKKAKIGAHSVTLQIEGLTEEREDVTQRGRILYIEDERNSTPATEEIITEKNRYFINPKVAMFAVAAGAAASLISGHISAADALADNSTPQPSQHPSIWGGSPIASPEPTAIPTLTSTPKSTSSVTPTMTPTSAPVCPESNIKGHFNPDSIFPSDQQDKGDEGHLVRNPSSGIVENVGDCAGDIHVHVFVSPDKEPNEGDWSLQHQRYINSQDFHLAPHSQQSFNVSVPFGPGDCTGQVDVTIVNDHRADHLPGNSATGFVENEKCDVTPTPTTPPTATFTITPTVTTTVGPTLTFTPIPIDTLSPTPVPSNPGNQSNPRPASTPNIPPVVEQPPAVVQPPVQVTPPEVCIDTNLTVDQARIELQSANNPESFVELTPAGVIQRIFNRTAIRRRFCNLLGIPTPPVVVAPPADVPPVVAPPAETPPKDVPPPPDNPIIPSTPPEEGQPNPVILYSQIPVGGTYFVRPGDNLSTIAVNMGVGLDALLRANPGYESHKDMIFPGNPLIRPTSAN